MVMRTVLYLISPLSFDEFEVVAIVDNVEFGVVDNMLAANVEVILNRDKKKRVREGAHHEQEKNETEESEELDALEDV